MTKEFLVFRADGNSNNGLGHMYRIFALIEMLKDDFNYILLVREDSVLSVIPKEYNFEIIPQSVNIENEPIWLAKKFSDKNVIVVADGYQFNSGYQKKLKKQGFKLVYIDDLASEYMYADLVVNHSPQVEENDYKSEPYTRFALGTKFAILRPLFLEAAKKDRKIDVLDTAFVCFGGADPFDLTFKAVSALLKIPQFTFINVILGGAYECDEIFELANKYPRKIKLYQNLSEKKLLKIMLECNFAIAPASTILYELCSVKMLVLSGYYVDNQKEIYKSFIDSNIVLGGGDFERYTIFDFENKINEAVESNKKKLLLLRQQEVFKGNSKKYFLGLINSINLSFRKARKEDILTVYNWSNDELVRKNSYSTEPITFEDHSVWFSNKVKSNNVLFLIALINGKPSGVVRYEIGLNNSTIGVLISKEYRGQGLAPMFIKKSAKIYFSNYALPIKAYIKKDNISSVNAFKGAGYRFEKEDVINGEESYIYKLIKNE